MFYELLFRRMPIPVALVDCNLIVCDASDAYAELVGAELVRLRDIPLAVVFATDEAARLARGAAGGGPRFEGGAVLQGGTAVRVHVEPLGGEDARGLALISSAADGADADARLVEIYSAIRTFKHEINNPLTGALGNINLLLRRADLDEKTRHRLATAEQEIKKVSQLVLRLSDLAPASQAQG